MKEDVVVEAQQYIDHLEGALAIAIVLIVTGTWLIWWFLFGDYPGEEADRD